MSDDIKEAPPGDITDDFILCNRCGSCRSVCPLFTVYREEWAAARGKVELAEAYFQGVDIPPEKIQEIFDLCLHCMTCEENCPSGMRADEIVMAVRADMARKGFIPRVKRMAFRALEGMDGAIFKAMRLIGLSRRTPLHGTAAKSPLRVLFPTLGWKRDRFFPLPSSKPFLPRGPELFEAADLAVTFDEIDPETIPPDGIISAIDEKRAARLIDLIKNARERNLSEKRRAYFFVGHTVNHFFPEEAEAIVDLLNTLGVDVISPKDQVCCGAPIYYSGDIEGARRAAAASLEKFEDHAYDWIVTSCSSGGLMLKHEMKRLFDISNDGYFRIEWDEEMETFKRLPGSNPVEREYPRIADIYNEYVEGKVYDVNELIAVLLGLEEKRHGFELLFGKSEEEGKALGAENQKKAETTTLVSEGEEASTAMHLPIVTYHQPCHLNRGQEVSWQPEALLRLLPGHTYVRMENADRCCGGGGMFTFLHGETAEKVAGVKMDAIEALRPDVLATACPVCRIQLMDMLNRRFVIGREKEGKSPRLIPVRTPPELLLADLAPVMHLNRRTSW